MGEQFFSEMCKRIGWLIVGWLIISMILIKVLFSYFMYYVQKEDAKVFYEINASTFEVDDTEYRAAIQEEQ